MDSMVIMYICYTSDKSACEISKIKRFMELFNGLPCNNYKKEVYIKPVSIDDD
jgi:hypothetical protein